MTITTRIRTKKKILEFSAWNDSVVAHQHWTPSVLFWMRWLQPKPMPHFSIWAQCLGICQKLFTRNLSNVRIKLCFQMLYGRVLAPDLCVFVKCREKASRKFDKMSCVNNRLNLKQAGDYHMRKFCINGLLFPRLAIVHFSYSEPSAATRQNEQQSVLIFKYPENRVCLTTNLRQHQWSDSQCVFEQKQTRAYNEHLRIFETLLKFPSTMNPLRNGHSVQYFIEHTLAKLHNEFVVGRCANSVYFFF